ncbi:MAG: hypothetical protein FWG45_00930 [Oscillospiraceae bacterium]|nr:hypothetical protein [Oscillospiraceae bacterium]
MKDSKELHIENTRIKIYDDYCRDKTEEDIEKSLKTIAVNALEALNRLKVESTA